MGRWKSGARQATSEGEVTRHPTHIRWQTLGPREGGNKESPEMER